MSLSAEAKDVLNRFLGSVANKYGLGTLLDQAHPSHKVVASGTFTTLGGDANESITVAGCLSTDLAIVQLKTKGATPRTILTSAAGSGAIAVEMSGDPSTDHVLKYVLFRAV